MKHPKPDKLVVIEGIPNTVHSAVGDGMMINHIATTVMLPGVYPHGS